MPTLASIQEHDRRTDRSAFRYQFTSKHHGADAEAAQWLPELTLEDEFAVFNLADQHDLSDDDGRLYGVLLVDQNLRQLGTWFQQIAEFPAVRSGEAWHGYPIWPANELAPENRRGQRMRPARVVFTKLERAGLIDAGQKRRLIRGRHA
jgi:hypothetical protein